METLDKIEKELNEKIGNKKHREGKVAKFIENQTAKLPSDTYLWAAIASIGGSLGLKIAKKNDLSLFVGQWASAFLLLGVYNKIVKTHGNDSSDVKKAF